MTDQLSPPALKHRRALQNRLLKWFAGADRRLPWVEDGTPYHIWVSEIMLQQTQIVTVIDYYNRFIKKFPTVAKLAAADLDDVLKMWEGLGYYRRARSLHAAAREIVSDHAGKFPTDFESVLSLPGVGRYTAAAILSISLDQPHAILEGNTIRLFSRLFAVPDDTTKSSVQKKLWQYSEQLVPRQRCGDFNQALMDLGRQICTPKNPDCQRCPIADFCLARIKGLQTQLPVRGKKMQYEDLHEAIVLAQRKGRVLMRHCQQGQRWAGLWDFPRARIQQTAKHRRALVTAQIDQSLQDQTGLEMHVRSLEKTIKHAVTKYRIRLDCYEAVQLSGRLKRGMHFSWKTKSEIQQLPLSTTGRKFADLYLSGKDLAGK